MLEIEGTDFVIDSTVYGNTARYSNHSCQPNAKLERYVLYGSSFAVVFIVALVGIPLGGKVTVDYGCSTDSSQPLVIVNAEPLCAIFTCSKPFLWIF